MPKDVAPNAEPLSPAATSARPARLPRPLLRSAATASAVPRDAAPNAEPAKPVAPSARAAKLPKQLRNVAPASAVQRDVVANAEPAKPAATSARAARLPRPPSEQTMKARCLRRASYKSPSLEYRCFGSP